MPSSGVSGSGRFYLRRCDELLYDDLEAGWALTAQAPALAEKIDAASSGANGADLMLLAYSYVGGAHRRMGDYDRAEEAYRTARQYKASASPKALAEHLRRLAYLRLCQKNPESFVFIEEAMAIHKKGNLVKRHAFGECLLCRGHAYVVFDQSGKSLDDWTAALNHLSLKDDPRTWYSTLHNLTVWAVDFGNRDEVNIAYDNLRQAQALLNTLFGRSFAKLKLRWLLAVLAARQGRYGQAEMAFLDVRKAMVKKKLGYEVGMLSIDLATMYLKQGRIAEAQQLADSTAVLFQRMGIDARAREALSLWLQEPEPSSATLNQVRHSLVEHAVVVPASA